MIAKPGPDRASHVNAAKDAAKEDNHRLNPSVLGIGKLLRKQLAPGEEANDENFAQLLAELARKPSGA